MHTQDFTKDFKEFEEKMRAAHMSDAIIRAFAHSYEALRADRTGMLPESAIQPVTDLPRLDATAAPADAALLRQTALVKLNGGLGTSMGLDQPKSLLKVRNGLTFLDIIARQVLHARQQSGVPLRLILMNSFSTSGPTRDWLARHP